MTTLNGQQKWIAFASLTLLFTSCATPIKTDEKAESVVHDDLAQNIVNSSEPSVPVRRLVRDLGIRRFLRRDPVEAITELEKRLAASPDDLKLRRSICELSIEEARRAEKKDASVAAGLYLTAAENAGLSRDETFLAIVSDSTARAVELLHDSGHDWSAPVVIPGALGDYTLSVAQREHGAVDPASFTRLVASDQLDLSGFRNRTRREGAGSPMVGTLVADSRWPTGAVKPERGELDLPLNALLDFRNGGVVTLTLHDLTIDDETAKRRSQLAADFTAPLATLMAQAPGPMSGIIATLRPGRFDELHGLQFLEPYRPDKIPVVLVHGLLGEPTTWRDTCNELLEDDLIRERYQIWLYRYATGDSILANAATLRRTLKAAHSYYAPRDVGGAMDRMVLVGYSLGGVLSSLQIRDSRDVVWGSYFKQPPEQLDLAEEQRRSLRERMFFKPQPFITRSIFIATPHRGSPLVRKPVSRLFSSLIRLPADALDQSSKVLVRRSSDALTELGEALAKADLNGLEELGDSGSNLATYVKLPMSDRVRVHSIVGDQGKGIGPDASDGWVPYKSAHLDEAETERVVPSDHHAHYHPETIVELRRILRLHLR